jgi:rod shape-determining protein MreD
VTRQAAALAAVIVLILTLQTTLLAPVRLLGARPDLLLLAVVAVATAAGAGGAAVFGFAAGLAADLLLDLPVGVSALVYTAIGYAVGSARAYLATGGVLVPAGLAVAASLAAVWASGALLRLLELSGFSWGFVGRAGLAGAALNLALTPAVYPPVHRLAERLATGRVTRW